LQTVILTDDENEDCRMEDKKDLSKLKRVELLDLLLDVTKENETIKTENEELKKKLKSREMSISEAGSIAEASLKLSGIFTVAQAAADTYLINIKKASAASDKLIAQAKAEAEKIAEDAEQKSEQILRDARAQAAVIKNQADMETQVIWQETREKISTILESENALKDLLGHLK